MKLHNTLVLCLIIFSVHNIHAASIKKRSADIPVQIIYEDPYASVRNLQEKTESTKPTIAVEVALPIAEPPTAQLQPEQPVVVEHAAETEPIKEEKIELPTPVVTEDIKQNVAVPEITNEIVRDAAISEDETFATPIHALKNLAEKPQLSYQQLKDVGKKAEKTKIVTGEPQPDIETISINYHLNEQSIDDVYQKIQEIVLEGANKIRANVERDSENVEPSMKLEILQKLNSTFEDFLETTKNSILLRGLKQTNPTNQNFVQTVVSNLQNAAATFTQNFQTAGQTGQSDEQQQTNNPVQFVINQIQNGFQQISNNINNVGGTTTQASTVLGDEAVTTAAPGFNPFQPFIQGGQQVIQNVQGFFNPTTGVPGVQGDDVTTQGNPILNAFQQIQNNVQQFISGGANPAPGTSGDTPAGGGNPIINTFQQLQSNVQQFNPFNQPTTASSAAGLQGDATTAPPAGSNPIINTIQQLQSNFQQLNPFGNREPVVAPGDTPVTTPSTNPIIGAIGTASSGIQSIIPVTPPSGIQGAANPIISAVQQAGQAANQFIPSTVPPVVGDLSNSAGATGFIDNIQTNVNQVIGGANPVQQVSQAVQSVIPSSDTPVTTAPISPLQSIVQNVQNLNPFRRRTTAAPAVAAAETTLTPASPSPVVEETNEVTKSVPAPVKITETLEDDNKVTSD